MKSTTVVESSIPGLDESYLEADMNAWQGGHDSDLDQDDSFYVPSTSFLKELATANPSLHQGLGDEFSTAENFDQTSAYVNHQLGIHGFPSNLNFMNSDKANASRIVTAFYKILQQHSKNVEYKEEMDLNWRRLSSDHDITLQNLNETKAQLEKSQRESAILGSRITALEEELRTETEKHRHAREELKSAKANLQYAKTQYTHEARKKEQELTVLKDKLQKAVDRTASTSLPGGITILNPVPRSLYGKQQTNETEHLLREVIEQQQAKETEVVEENEQLRRTLCTVHIELESLIKKHPTSNSPTTSPYGLPFEMAKNKIETQIRDLLVLFSAQWNHRPSQDPSISPSEIVVRDQMIEDLQKQVQKLQLELEDSTLLVQGAQKMIDNLSSGNFLAGLQDLKLTVEDSDMTHQEMDEEEAKIIKQRDDLAKERKIFTQACLDLGKQREELEQARREFEESKRTFRLDNVMSFLSFSPRLEGRTLDRTPPSSPSRHYETISKKRVATSPLSSCILDGRSVRPKTAVDLPDEDIHGFQHRKVGSLFGRDDSDEDDNDEVEVEEEEEEEEEVLMRTHSRLRPTLGMEDPNKSHRETGKRTDSSAALPSVPASPIAASKTPSRTRSSTTQGFSLFGRSNATPTPKPKPGNPTSSSKTSSSSSRTTQPTSVSKSSSFSFAASHRTSKTNSNEPGSSPRRAGGVGSPRKQAAVAPSSKMSGSRSNTPTSTPVKRVALGSTLNLPRTPTPIFGSSTSMSDHPAGAINSGKVTSGASSHNSGKATQTTTSNAPMRLIDAAKVPSAFSKTAARLAAAKNPSIVK
ncbi:MAG: Afadin and alpha-actinin-binding-domain-containing protein [Benniella sp.]|nr:MAG: Afadin and alpha-actinin-binding-domain-containing protein [Benniella sp.]